MDICDIAAPRLGLNDDRQMRIIHTGTAMIDPISRLEIRKRIFFR
jgi:hypothetical protein